MTARRPLSNAVALALCYVLALQVSLGAFQMAQAAVPGALAILCTANLGPQSDGSPGRVHPVEHACLLCPMPMCAGGLAPVSAPAPAVVRTPHSAVLRPEVLSGTLGQAARREPNAARGPPALA
ncbi:MAG TPA: hypothetical protein VHA77_18060 [Xanthobacteraceae bacterium]|nr:hypothetical protein [Xanthobacteraceae bacterium]